MLDKKHLLKELGEKFKELQKELGFETSFDDLDSAFFISDYVLSSEFVSETFSRQLCSRIVETLQGWMGYLESLLIPNPQSFVSQTESKLFQSEEYKKKIWDAIKEVRTLSSMNSLAGLKKDKVLEKEFIDSAFIFWRDMYSPLLVEILGKINVAWKKE